MKAHNTTSGSLLLEDLSKQGNNPASISRQVLLNCVRDVVTCDPIRKGDFKRPNPWQYTAYRSDERYVGVAAYVDNSLAVPTTHSLTGGSTSTHNMASYLWEAAIRGRDFTALYNAALSDLNENIRGSIDLSIDLAQAGQTFASVNFQRRLTKVYQFYRSIRNPLKAMKEVGGKWLEWQYGIKPTLQTIYDIANYSSRMARNQYTTFDGHAKKRFQLSPTSPLTVIMSGYSVSGIPKVEGYGRGKVKISVTMDTSQFPSLADFTSLNPASIAWELLPWSFVIDWFLNVGNYLRDTETAFLYQKGFKEGFITYFESLEGDFSFSGRQPNIGVFTNRSCSLNSYSSYRWSQRVVLSSYPLPRFPSLDVKLGSGRLLNAAALLSQFLGKGR